MPLPRRPRRRRGLLLPRPAGRRRAHRTATTSTTTTASTPSAAAPSGWQALVAAARGARARRRRRHRAQPHGRRRRERQRSPGGTCCGSAASSPFADWFDIEWSTGRIRLPVLGDDVDPTTDLRIVRRRAALRRAPLPDRARHRADRPARPADVHDAPALRAGELPPGRHRAELPPLLRRHHAGRPAGRGRSGGRGHPPRDPALGATRTASPACGSTTRTGWPTPAATSTGCGRTRPRPGSRSRRSSSRARCCRAAGRSPAPPATTRWPR